MLPTEASYSLISSDAPSLLPEEDEFGYKGFAKIIAEIICHAKAPNGLVLAIHGSWGSGKTSAINYVKYYLNEAYPTSKIIKKKPNQKVIIADFNPWWFTNNQNLTCQFLVCFEAKLCHSRLSSSAKETVKRYASAILKNLAQTTIPFVKDAAQIGGVLLDEFSQKNLFDLKDKVTSALAKSKQKFVFVIDDIDRLTKEEVRELFRTIKILADFPNVIYLLAFDAVVVANSLKGFSGDEDGHAYLEKIVQVPFALPLIKVDRSWRIFHGKIEMVVHSNQPEHQIVLGLTELHRIYDAGLYQLVRTPRQIKRIVNVLSVMYPVLRLRVALADMVAIECIRMALPKLYNVIRDNRSYFALDDKNIRFKKEGNFERADANAFHAIWKEDLPALYRNSVINIMELLFPQSLKNAFPDSPEAKPSERKRIYRERVLDAYFRLRIFEPEPLEEKSAEQTEEPLNLLQESELI